MQYITHHRMKGIVATGERMNIPYGSTFETVGDFIATADAKAICYTTSELAYEFFARNDDGRGLERGQLTHAIAYKPRERYSAEGRRQRFTDQEIEILETRWGKFLRSDTDVIRFNHDFFNAEVDELAVMAGSLNIKV
jgi:hypothetical protein